MLTRDSVHPPNYRGESFLPQRELLMESVRWLCLKWLATLIRESTSREGEHVRT